ncbi:threonylcarbamoyl-AMP synthase [Chloroflexia bacterium SDU3-3]|nr:threonylcarbamoyl-AMP synthase [Chloroflexia bacterium SDU3-3]
MTISYETQLLAVDPLGPAPERVALAADVLRRGELVAFPTETVYGLGANAFDPEAVARIFAAKRRPTSDPLIVHIHALDQLEAIVRAVPQGALALVRRYWPGPLTLVMPRGQRIPPNVSAGMDSVAVRMPDHPVALALLRAAGLPVAAPSANLFTRPSPTTAAHVMHDLAGRIPMVLDGGPTRIGLESTVVSLLGPRPELLRPGGIPIEDLRAALPDLLYQPRYVAEDHAAAAPGQMLKHYAPDAPVLLYRGPRAAALASMLAEVRARLAQGQRVGALVGDEDAALFREAGALVASLGSCANLAEVGARLFAGLRALESTVDVMVVRSFEQGGLGLAIWDRLLRATEGHVIEVG